MDITLAFSSATGYAIVYELSLPFFRPMDLTMAMPYTIPLCIYPVYEMHMQKVKLLSYMPQILEIGSNFKFPSTTRSASSPLFPPLA